MPGGKKLPVMVPAIGPTRWLPKTMKKKRRGGTAPFSPFPKKKDE